MAGKTIAITDCDHPSVDIEKRILMEEDFHVQTFQCKTEEEVIQNCRDADGIIVQYAPLTEKVLTALPACKVIANYGVGVDNIDVETATGLGIQVCNVPDYGYEEVSDHALAMLLNLVRKLTMLNNQTKNNIWDFQIARPIKRLKAQTLGVVGLGGIGLTLAKKAQALGINVIGYSRSSKHDLGFETVSFDYLIKHSDIVSIHLPLNDDTYHLFNRNVFSEMQQHAILINTARGAIVDEMDLVDALKHNQIGGAGIDVLEKEPGEKNHPLYQCNNAIITPHSAWYSEETIVELKEKVAKEARAFLLGKDIKYPVNVIKK
ncbi:C-terminal binding protein [Oceanobacillus timonensis]|uniref:C-terminal binding protein n=1 Tax=Oceanobacillus timonensis TaxID=1926285 RepID=UPI0009B97601|nr:C-terminal binding protein [Oceanobacillus timonensis]